MGARYTTVVKALNSNTSVIKARLKETVPNCLLLQKRFAVN